MLLQTGDSMLTATHLTQQQELLLEQQPHGVAFYACYQVEAEHSPSH